MAKAAAPYIHPHLSGLSSGLFAQAAYFRLMPSRRCSWPGDEGDGCYRVEEGLLKASVAAPNGGERILAISRTWRRWGDLTGCPASKARVAELIRKRWLPNLALEIFSAPIGWGERSCGPQRCLLPADLSLSCGVRALSLRRRPPCCAGHPAGVCFFHAGGAVNRR